jgi:alginate O-acetyltransferase complex protein AlgI
MALHASVSQTSPRVAGMFGGALSFAIVGISYMGFKFIHFHIDKQYGEFKRFEPLEFVNWLLFFPSIVAGPMQRFQDWQAQRSKTTITLSDAIEGAERLVLGLFMKFVLANSIRGFSLAQMGPGPVSIATPSQFIEATAIYPIYLYLDFAGYSNIAIGTGRFWGISLPENFNYPFLSRNLAEFWNRWHISLSSLLRDYLYYPLSLQVKRREFFRKRQNLAAAIPPFLTFSAVGLWHGLSAGFAIYGMIHGLGLAFLAVARRKRTHSRFAIWWHSSPSGRIGGAILNYGYVAFSFFFFALSDADLAIILHRLQGRLPQLVG